MGCISFFVVFQIVFYLVIAPQAYFSLFERKVCKRTKPKGKPFGNPRLKQSMLPHLNSPPRSGKCSGTRQIFVGDSPASSRCFGLQRTCQNTFVALGQAKVSLFIALLRKVILLVPLAYILPAFMGVTGVYTAEAVADAAAAILCTLIFAFSFNKILWKNKNSVECKE